MNAMNPACCDILVCRQREDLGTGQVYLPEWLGGTHYNIHIYILISMLARNNVIDFNFAQNFPLLVSIDSSNASMTIWSMLDLTSRNL